MDWLTNLSRSKSNKKSTQLKSTQLKSTPKLVSKNKDVRYYVKSTDNKVVKAHKRENGPGYVYHKKTADGLRRIPIKGTTYKSEEDAKKKAQKIREDSKKKRINK